MRIVTALLFTIAPAFVSAGEWSTDYARAYETAQAQHKPIFVYFTDSAQNANWKSNFEGMQPLADNFVLVVADKSDKTGPALFKSFEINSNHGAVVVESEGKWQYFRTERELDKNDLSKVMTECKAATGKPTPSVLSLMSHKTNDVIPSSSSTGMIRSSNYCPNCQRFR